MVKTRRGRGLSHDTLASVPDFHRVSEVGFALRFEDRQSALR